METASAKSNQHVWHTAECLNRHASSVLIVEDEVIVAEALHDTLLDLGYSVAGMASSGAAAIQRAQQTRPDVVLMDICLTGELDGVSAAQAIRDQLGTPVVYLTALSDAETIARATQSQPFGFLIKPFRGPELRGAIEVALSTRRLERRLHEDSRSDSLTGLANRLGVDEAVDRQITRASHEHSSVAVLLVDIDHFKRVNDLFGHAAGDEVLMEVAQVLRQFTRPGDIVGRMGGEEFVAVLPGADVQSATSTAQRLRTEMQALELLHQDQKLGPVTVSIGVAVYPDDGMTAESVFAAADAALYRAKRQGRNRVTLAS